MKTTVPLLKQELRLALLLLLPMIVSGFIEAAPGFINNIMLARLGADKLAAGALVSMLFSTIQVLFYGIFTTVSTLISHHHGANEKDKIGKVVRDALIFSVFLSIPLMILVWHGEFLLRWLGQSAETLGLARHYLHGLTFSIIPDFASMVLWHFFIGLGKPRVTLTSTFIYVPLNIFVAYSLIFGAFGLPQLGVWGIGLGNAVAFLSVFILLLGYILLCPQYRQYFVWQQLKKHDYRLKDLIIVGLPVGFMWTTEVFFGLLMAAFIGRVSIVSLAAHQVAMQTFMFIFVIIGSIAQVMTVRIGHSYGAQQYERFPAIAYSGLMIVTVYGCCVLIVCALLPKLIIGMDFNLADPQNATVIHLATAFLLAMGIMQIFDGIRFTLFGLLRGFKDTYFSFFVSVLCFFGIALPLGYGALFYWGWSPVSFWYCTLIGISVAALLLGARFQRLNRKLTCHASTLSLV